MMLSAERHSGPVIKPLKQAFAAHAGQKVVFADTRSDGDVRAILKHAVGRRFPYRTRRRLRVLMCPFFFS